MQQLQVICGAGRMRKSGRQNQSARILPSLSEKGLNKRNKTLAETKCIGLRPAFFDAAKLNLRIEGGRCGVGMFGGIKKRLMGLLNR